MVLFTKEYFPMPVYCLLPLIFRLWSALLKYCGRSNLSSMSLHARFPQYASYRAPMRAIFLRDARVSHVELFDGQIWRLSFAPCLSHVSLCKFVYLWIVPHPTVLVMHLGIHWIGDVCILVFQTFYSNVKRLDMSLLQCCLIRLYSVLNPERFFLHAYVILFHCLIWNICQWAKCTTCFAFSTNTNTHIFVISTDDQRG